MDQQFAGQVGIVTGAAGEIGASVAMALAQRGCRVCCVDYSQAALDDKEAKLRNAVAGADVISIAVDVGDSSAVNRSVQRTLAKWSRVDVLIQCAGITGKTGINTADVTDDNFDSVLRVNLRGIFAFCRAVLPAMCNQRYGRIVNVASIAGKEGNAGMLPYSASKAAVIGLTKVIGKEYANSGDITCE